MSLCESGFFAQQIKAHTPATNFYSEIFNRNLYSPNYHRSICFSFENFLAKICRCFNIYFSIFDAFLKSPSSLGGHNK
ncbi:MAG: hypothetical protein DYG98_04110 [Haliscomenobacteraceae bacterium CHB4]|nr:hypothetical protein [Haliscomenobacteraceae bacterium CHB4]